MIIDKMELPKDKNINLRIDQDSLDLISLAAKEKGMSRSAYMIQATRRKAQKEILDQHNYFLNDESWNEFNVILESSPKENDKLKKLMKKIAPWDNHNNDLKSSST